MTHFKISQSLIISALTAAVGFVVAFVPSLAGSEQVLISAGSSVIAAVFLIANSLHHIAAAKSPGGPVAAKLPFGLSRTPQPPPSK